MNFPSIDIQGSILSSDLLSKIRSEQAAYQSGKDFRPDFTNAKLKDEISFAWQEAKGQWTIFKSKLARMKPGEVGTTENRNFWILPLLTNLGYNLTFNRQAEEINGKLFSIGYRDTVLDNFPVYVGGYHESLDKRPESKTLRVSPHAMVQEYLNHSEHMYGIVTNGRQLRLLRDASRITRLSYVEFNLEKMLEEDLYSDFVILYRILHASRMPKRADNGAESIIEKYHQEGLEAGSAIRSKLGEAVKHAIKDLANGFINHPNNYELRESIQSGKFNIDEYYRHQLRIIYRLLFLFVIEERNLVYTDSKTPETKRYNEIYFKYYSLMRLRKMARKIVPPDAHRHFDLWRSLVATFALFEKKQIGEKLGIMSLQGDLFGYYSLTSSSYDLHDCNVSNAVILNIIKSLTYFENDNGVLIAVNYGGLDVEEFGSVYEGLLELKLAINKVEGSEKYTVGFDTSTERGKSGSHYTPEELVQPLIKHSLDYLIADKLKEKDPAAALLSLKVADVACGSGHILLSAARRIAHELACIIETRESRSKEKIEQPSPAYVRKAMKEVVRNCIYGVDKNPLAVELCKVALWLEAYNPGEPLNFLDHHIKCGDAIVGLAHRNELEQGIPDGAFKTLPGDDKDVAKAWRDKNSKERKEREAKALQLKADFEKVTENSVQESMAEYRSFNQLPESTPEEIERKANAYRKFIEGRGFTSLRAMADAQVAQFFIPKTPENKEYLMTDADFRMILSGYNKSWQDRKVAKALAVSVEHRFFHWFLEFPEVISRGGFSCVLGNPPYIAGRDLKQKVGPRAQHFILSKYVPNEGRSDIVAYFFRRISSIINDAGLFALISTNTISQGDTRYSSLDYLIAHDFKISFAHRNIPWPGEAGVTVTLLSICKASNDVPVYLGGTKVISISSRLEASSNAEEKEPYLLKENAKHIFQGTTIYGEGFKITKETADKILKQNPKYKDVIFPFLTGDDINENVESAPSEIVINFHDWPDAKAKDYPECYQIVEQKVKPERLQKGDKQTKEKWWLYMRSRIESYRAIKEKKFVLVAPIVSKYLSFVKFEPGIVFSNKTVVVTFTDKTGILHSSLYNAWVYKYSTTLGSATLNFSIDDCFKKYPFPIKIDTNTAEQLSALENTLHEERRKLSFNFHLGLTRIYNLFNSPAIDSSGIDLSSKIIQAAANHFEKNDIKHSVKDLAEAIVRLRKILVSIDELVIKIYGWHDIQLRHGFYDMDFLPENDRQRFTIHPDARKEVLKRLLDLNHIMHAEEMASGLLDKKARATKSKKHTIANEPESGYGSLFSNKQ